MLRFCVALFLVAPANTVGDSREGSVPLTDEMSFPKEHRAALRATAKHVQKLGYAVSDYLAVTDCDARTCRVAVYSAELEMEKFDGYFGCPVEYCATLTFSKESQAIIEVSPWR